MFKKIKLSDFKENFTEKLSTEWSLITAGTENDGFNMMTASWGFIGEMWGKPCLLMVVRPERYTMQFIEKNGYFTVSFHGYNKKLHSVCGSKSGRDTDKVKEASLKPVFKNKYVLYEDAQLTFICKKLYVQPMDAKYFTDCQTKMMFSDKGNMHNIIVGEIAEILKQE